MRACATSCRDSCIAVLEYASTSTSKTLGAPGGTTKPPDYYSLGDLLDLAGTSYETIKGAGATLAVSFSWTCFVDSAAACAPQLQVSRLDTYEKRHGYQTQYGHYYRSEKGAEGTRDLYTAKGVRLLLTTRGEGKRVSINAIMVQISSCIALLWLAGVAADFIMIYVLPERKHYRTYKQERTPDFSGALPPPPPPPLPRAWPTSRAVTRRVLQTCATRLPRLRARRRSCATGRTALRPSWMRAEACTCCARGTGVLAADVLLGAPATCCYPRWRK